jgi:hypothetical protein
MRVGKASGQVRQLRLSTLAQAAALTIRNAPDPQAAMRTFVTTLRGHLAAQAAPATPAKRRRPGPSLRPQPPRK